LVAHTPSPAGRWHSLGEHCRAVGDLAAEFASPFGGQNVVRLAGYLHDAGKATAEVQARLRALGNSTSRSHEKLGVPHKFEGAQLAAGLIGRWCQGPDKHLLARGVYQLMAGHHSGIPANDGRTTDDLRAALTDISPLEPLAMLMSRLVDADPTQLATRAAYPPSLWSQVMDLRDPTPLDLFTRMCHSALVDADFLDTAAHFGDHDEPWRARTVGMGALRDTFMRSYAAAFRNAPDTPINRLRADVFAASVAAGTSVRTAGIYRLPAQTGTGKTMAAAGFALAHAARFDKRRIIVAVPFTTITTQNADAYRKMFGEQADAVLEHHSAIVDERIADDMWRRLSAPQWDGEFIVTTTVQLFESLFSNRPSRTRKLHRIVGSVIVLDEVQALPLILLSPILRMLRDLVEHFGVTVLLASATQPAFWNLPVWEGLPVHNILPVDVVPDVTRRVTYEVQQDRKSWEAVADEIAAQRQVLVVVNTRRHVDNLYGFVAERVDEPATVYLLSRSMTADHRRRVLADVTARLDAGESVALISTQLIEAGVDIDFPVVYRALAPADAVVQAAGRCNRNGKLTGRGRVVVFDPEVEDRGFPDTVYATLAGITASTYQQRADSFAFDDPKALAHYYSEAYATVRQINERACDFAKWRRDADFPKVADEFRMIEDDGMVDVVVPTHPDPEIARRLAQVLEALSCGTSVVLDARTRRFLERYSASARRADLAGASEELPQGVVVWRGAYDPRRGLLAAQGLTW
jgi:CRISPR-associated endonuclease/helicase Cas3